MTRPPTSRIVDVLAVAASLCAAAAWVVYERAGLILSHYDAKAHLVVARRVFDNITPGWQQIGAVWLPLPHLINILPTQVDFFYRTGVFASLVSVVCLGVTAWAAARLVLASTGSLLGAVVAMGLLATNPNLLYLYATPMTEPLLLAVSLVALLWLYEWVERDEDAVPWRLGLILFAATWTRYEAWPILAGAGAAATYAMWRRTGSAAVAARRALRLSAWPIAAAAIFMINSRITVGSWFVTGGFYVADPTYERQMTRTLLGVWWGTHQLSGYAIEIVALTAAAVCVIAATRRAGASWLVPASLFAAAALPVYAFYAGHPYRIRYMIPAVAACAVWGGIGVGLAARRGRIAAAAVAAVLVASMAIESPPWKAHPPMLDEAEWDLPDSHRREAVTACLAAYHGEKVLASMGSLAHYMQELSRSGFHLADFINEGNGIIWQSAMQTGPAAHAGWMLVEEQAEGGDVLARRIESDATFARGMQRICEGGGVALYRRMTTLVNAK